MLPWRLGLATAQAVADDTLDPWIASEWSSLDPQVNFDSAADWILADAYEGLINFDKSGKIVPGADAGHRPRGAGKQVPRRRRSAGALPWRGV